MSYVYYQVEGGTEEWTPLQADMQHEFKNIKPTFVTVLTVDSLVPDKPTKEQIDNLKYQGPMYFDLDSPSLEESILDANDLVKALKSDGLTDTDMQIFLSGKKGLHILIPQEVFMNKPAAVKRLPAVYREIALHYAVPSVDFKVYSARRGRMLRTCWRQRDKPNTWRVPISATMLETLTPESYMEWCSEPRTPTVLQPSFRFKMALVYDEANNKIPKTPRRVKPVATHIVQSHWSDVRELFEGQVQSNIGFNTTGMQMSLYARDAGWSEEQFINSARGFLQNHQGDGRYGTENVRERELRKLFHYVQDNEGYTYSLAGVMACISKGAPTDEYADYEDGGSSNISEIEREFSGGLKATGSGLITSTGNDGTERAITNFILSSVKKLKEPETGELITIRVAGKMLKADGSEEGAIRHVDIAPTQFTGGTAFQNSIATAGMIFTGSDMNARGLLHTVSSLQNTPPNEVGHDKQKVTVETSYVIPTEGLSLVKLPHEPDPEIRGNTYMVWADNRGVTMPKVLEGRGISFSFVGYPSAKGVLRTDLSLVGDIRDAIANGQKDAFIKMWHDLLQCHPSKTIAKIVGWMGSASFRPLFQSCYGKYPLLHVYGPAGAGKTELVMSLLHLFYDREDPKSATPSGTFYAFQTMIAATASIPVVLDEYKPHKMNKEVVERYRGLFRDAYNGKSVTRGGGNRASEKATALQEVKLQGPLAFIAEAIESETAILERSLVVNVRPQPAIAAAQGLTRFLAYKEQRELLTMFGKAMSAWVLNHWTEDKLRKEFDDLHKEAIATYMLSEQDVEAFKDGSMSPDKFNSKSRIKSRPVYNATVALFGIRQVARMLAMLVGKDTFKEIFGDMFHLMASSVYADLDAIGDAAVPEYVKALRTIAEMIIAPMNDNLRLTEGVEFNLTRSGDREVFVFAPALVYSRYRAHMRACGQEPLYDNDISFITALRDAPQFIQMGWGTARTQIKTVALDYTALVTAGMPLLANARFATLPEGRLG